VISPPFISSRGLSAGWRVMQSLLMMYQVFLEIAVDGFRRPLQSGKLILGGLQAPS